MSINFNNVASYNPTTGYTRANRTIQQKEEYKALDTNPTATAYDELEPEVIRNAKANGVSIKIANEEQFWQEVKARKEAQMLMGVCNIYTDAGIENIAPQSYEDISDTDKVLVRLCGTPLGRWALLYEGLSAPDVERTAFKIAEMEVWLANHYSDEEIKKRIDDTISAMGLSGENIDKEFLFNTTKAAGRSYEDTLNASAKEIIDSMSLRVAKNMYNVLAPGYDYLKGGTVNAEADYDSNFKAFLNSYSDLVRNAIKECTNLLNKGTYLTSHIEEDTFSIVRQIVRDNININFNVGGKNYTSKELYENYKNVTLFG